MSNNPKLLDEEIERRIEELQFIEQGSDEESKAIDNVVKLYRLRIDENKAVSEDDERFIRREMDKEIHKREAEEKAVESKWRWVERFATVTLQASAIIVPVVAYGRWFNRSLKFEETGSFVNTTSKNLFNKFKPW